MNTQIKTTKTQLALFDAKKGETNDLNWQLQQQMADKQEEQEKVEELQLYIKMQEEHYSEHGAKLELKKSEMNTNYEQLADRYEQKRMMLLVAEAKL